MQSHSDKVSKIKKWRCKNLQARSNFFFQESVLPLSPIAKKCTHTLLLTASAKKLTYALSLLAFAFNVVYVCFVSYDHNTFGVGKPHKVYWISEDTCDTLSPQNSGPPSDQCKNCTNK